MGDIVKKRKFSSVEEYLQFKLDTSGTAELCFEKNILEQYNTPRFKISSDYQFIPEKELWDKRNHNYKMWL